ncbi:MAG: EamA family transporter RarD, partial [Planctomycetes bacterium]|nr:EamA family transporter RarD [Planctomycetota bacterium]
IVVGLIGRTGEILAIVRAGGATRRAYLVSTTLISVNWFIFIYAIQTDRLLHASLGYYITPLVNVAMGMAFLGERLSLRQGAAVALATLGVGNLIIFYGTLPWIALALAMSFGTYALVRKKARIDPLVGLLVETLAIAPLAIGFLAWLAVTGVGHFGPGAAWPGLGWGDGWGMSLLLIAAGPVTGIPLVLYMMGAARLKLGTIGLMQYSAPTLQFLIAVWVFGEVFTPAHAVTFALIWTGLVLYSWDMVRSLRRGGGPARAAEPEPSRIPGRSSRFPAPFPLHARRPGIGKIDENRLELGAGHRREQPSGQGIALQHGDDLDGELGADRVGLDGPAPRQVAERVGIVLGLGMNPEPVFVAGLVEIAGLRPGLALRAMAPPRHAQAVARQDLDLGQVVRDVGIGRMIGHHLPHRRGRRAHGPSDGGMQLAVAAGHAGHRDRPFDPGPGNDLRHREEAGHEGDRDHGDDAACREDRAKEGEQEGAATDPETVEHDDPVDHRPRDQRVLRQQIDQTGEAKQADPQKAQAQGGPVGRIDK